MHENEGSWIRRNRIVLSLAAIVILTGAWWAFRPEKLFINQKVNESAPFASAGDPQPEYTGKLEGQVHHTSGRATIYRLADGQRSLRLTDFNTSNGPDVHVLLARAQDKTLDQDVVKGNLDGVELGTLKGNQGDQNYGLPSDVDLEKYQAVVIYCERFHAVFGVARLEKF
jgi:Electron transfer DM13